jgi:Flp pilus assembly protein TadD
MKKDANKKMGIINRIVLILLCLFAFSCTESPQKIIEKAKKSVVTIKTPSGSGSGFIASADGLIITNNHVVGNNETVEVHFQDGRTTVASSIKKGLSVLDVAYLKVDGSKFDYLPMNTNCSTGDEVYAIGAPLGLSESVSKGIISNCDRTIKGVKFIQTDAAVNAGNSSGPLINKKGEVVGLLTFKISAEGVEGLNFALSPAVVRDYYENKLTNLEEALKKEVADKYWVDKGNELDKVGSHKQAIEAFTKAIAINSQNGAAYWHRGLAFDALGNHQQAIDDFSRALMLKPQSVGQDVIYVDRAVVHANIGNYNQAISDGDKAVEINPQNSFAYGIRGFVYLKLRNYAEAIWNYNKAIDLNPRNAEAYYMRGLIQGVLQSDSQKSIQDISTAARLGNKDAQDFLMSRGIQW